MKQKIFVSSAVLAMCFVAQSAFARNVDIATPSGAMLSNAPLTPSGNPAGNLLLTGNVLTPGSELGQSFVANATEATIGLFLEKSTSCDFTTTVTLNLYSGEGTDPVNLLHTADYALPSCFRGFVETNYRDAGIYLTIGNTYTISVSSPITTGGNYIVPTATGGAPIGMKITKTGTRKSTTVTTALYGGIFPNGNAIINGAINNETVVNNNTATAAVVWSLPTAMPGDHYYRLQDLNPERFTFVNNLTNAQVGQPYTPTNLLNPSSLLLGVVYATAGVPAGMSVSTTGVLSGTPTTPGTYTISLAAYLSAASNIGDNGFGTVTITVDPGQAPAIVPVTLITSLSNGTVGSSYSSKSLLKTGTATVTATGVPAGMKVSAAGALSGTPTTAGTYDIVITATDSTGVATVGVVTITIDPATAVQPIPVTNAGGKITAMGSGYVMLETIKVSYTPSTVITGTLAIGAEILYSGNMYSELNIAATQISVK